MLSKVFTWKNLLLLPVSTALTLLSMFVLPALFFSLTPEVSWLEGQAWFLFGHIFFLYTITACLYAVAGCFIGIKTDSYKGAIVKSVLAGFGLFFSFIIIGSFFGGSYIMFAFSYFFAALPFVAAVVFPALLLRYLCTRVKLSKYTLFAIAAVIIFAAYILLSGVLGHVQGNRPELDYMYETPPYRGVTQQVVENSQFQLERGRSSRGIDYVGLGSFPAIGYCAESAIMVSEFCNQHIEAIGPVGQYSYMESVIPFDIEWALHSLVRKQFFADYIIYSDRYNTYNANYDEKGYYERPMDIVILPGKPDASYQDWDDNTVEITSEPIALDALVFIVHKDNPIDSLTTEQLRGIYTGIIRNWQELGGNRQTIKNYQRNDLSFTHSVIMKETVMQGAPMIKPVEANNGLGDYDPAAYQNLPGSIGYCLLSFLESDGFGLGDEIKILGIDGVRPDEASIRSGAYPHVVTFYAAIRAGEETGEYEDEGRGARFLEWILSDEGQACIRLAGYLPIDPRH